MKKVYLKITAFIVLLCVLSVPLGAQLSGVYTINSGASTGGTNYQTFNDFANDINTNGVSGTVVVNVVTGTGPYNEQVLFNQITGISLANNVVINGNGNLLTFNATSSAQPWTLGLSGTDYFTVNNLNVEGTGTFYALVCKLSTGADYNNFNNCTFVCNVNGTATGQCPFSISSSMTSATSGGSMSGNFNTITSCTMSNGYYGFVSYGPTGNPWTVGNSIIDCRITDFYYYGTYFNYNRSFTMKGCLIDRVTRTSSSTTYPIYGIYNNDAMIDGNRVEKLREAQQGATSSIYFYMYYQSEVMGPRNVFKNNIITNIKSNGTIYFYMYNGAWDVLHNTFDWDYAGGNHTGTLYGLYAYGSSTYGELNIYNNLITIRKPGTGTRYGIYTGGNTGYTNIDYNNIITGGASSDYVGYYSAQASNLAAWQAQGADLNGYSVDPQYVSASDLHPTNATINNVGIPRGVMFDHDNAVRHQTTPDIGAYEFLTPMCASTPTQTVAGPNFSVCPGESVTFSIGGLSADLGYTYQWQVSNISSVGLYTLIPGANSISYKSPGITGTTWYSAIITCSAPGGSSIAPVAQVNVAGTTTNVVPYYEGFEGIGLPNRLPNCSWMAPNIGSMQQTNLVAASGNRLPRNGAAYATFNNSTPGTNYYYTNGIWMEPGVTYSASVWYQTDFTGATNWSDLSIMLGTAQSPSGLTTIATTGGPAVSPVYKSLSNIFTVSAPGFYHVAIAATSAAGTAQYLTWDDLSIIIPCTPSLNTPTVTLSASSSTVCSGQPVTLTAAGADNYSWDNGATGAVLTDYPGVNTTYMVTGTSALTGCSLSLSKSIVVKQSPNLAVFAVPPVVCSGKPTSLVASGATTYNWSTGANGSNISVSPTANTSYSVSGTNTSNCTSFAVVQVSVNPLPNVTGNVSNNLICKGEPVVLMGGGAVNYEWVSTSPASVLQGANATTYPSESLSYTVTGTDANGCSNTAVVAISVDPCLGISKSAAATGLSVFPNPTSGEITITTAGGENLVELTDVTGRVILAEVSSESNISLNMSGVAAGVYYVKVQSAERTGIVKVIKQ